MIEHDAIRKLVVGRTTEAVVVTDRPVDMVKQATEPTVAKTIIDSDAMVNQIIKSTFEGVVVDDRA